jgi:hypothetical protein
VSDTPCPAYLNFLMQPNNPGAACTPFGMHSKTIDASGCLHRDLRMGCFPFLFVGALDGPVFGSPSSLPDSGCPVISSIFTSSCGVDPTISCDPGPLDMVLSPSMPFVWWPTSTPGFFQWFYVTNEFCSPSLLCGSMSILSFFKAFPSSYTSVSLTGSSCGEAIVLTSTIPFNCACTYSSHVGSCRDLVLLRVFLAAWLGVVPSCVYFLTAAEIWLIKSSKSHVHYSYSCSSALCMLKFTMRDVWPAFWLYKGCHKCCEYSWGRFLLCHKFSKASSARFVKFHKCSIRAFFSR